MERRLTLLPTTNPSEIISPPTILAALAATTNPNLTTIPNPATNPATTDPSGAFPVANAD
ncbi:MAG: hypothetical protein LUD52_03535 [Opitutae bacterium]|nr:hypothetical protein [Opitutae bacterium]